MFSLIGSPASHSSHQADNNNDPKKLLDHPVGTMEMTNPEEAAAMPNGSASSPHVLVENGVVLETENETSNQTTDVRLRQGTISSARFNILCTMVGGGSLSLPMAFRKAGNGLVAPCLLVLTAALTDACFRMIVGSSRRLSPVAPDETVAGKESYESLANATFGPRGHFYTKWLVTAVCFFGAVAYAVLLRDLLQPLTHAIAPHTLDLDASGGPTLAGNITMWIVILLVTPLCGLQNLSSLDKLGAASMTAILIVGCCVVYRSMECLAGISPHKGNWPTYKLWPDSAKDVLDALPLYVSCYVCHYNLPLVHNELQNATPERVNWWLRSTTVSASIFYMVIGLVGSAYGHCTPTGTLQGNVLLDFDEGDPLLLVGRLCLACTVTLAFPLLVIPARDILIRSWFDKAPPAENAHPSEPLENSAPDASTIHDSAEAALREPLLEYDTREDDDVQTREQSIAATTSEASQFQQHSFAVRLGTGILVLWSSAAVASCVKSIDVVWELLGSSLSIMLSYLIPCAAFIAIMGQSTTDAGDGEDENKGAIFFAKAMLCVYLPLMLISTGNAFANTFFA